MSLEVGSASMKAKRLPGRRSTGTAAVRREVAEGSPRPGRRPQAAAPSRKTCLLIISDAGLEIALRSAVELLADVTCETLSLNRLASLTRAEGRELDQLVLSPESFLIVDSRTEGLPSLQPLIRRLKGRDVSRAGWPACPPRETNDEIQGLVPSGSIPKPRCSRSWTRSARGWIPREPGSPPV